jgi:hypothetical protein
MDKECSKPVMARVTENTSFLIGHSGQERY